MGRKSRGISIGTYLIAIAAFSVMISTLTWMATHHLHFATVMQQQQAARNLAESALNEALVRVLNSPNQGFGVNRGAGDKVELSSSLYPGARALVTFHPSTARDHDIPASFNNLYSTVVHQDPGSRKVPVNTLYLVALGTYGESRKKVEMLYYIPPFPSALASEGPVRSTGGLLVAGVRDPANFPGNYDQVPPEDRAPSHVVRNFSGANAIHLGSGANIQGNVGAVGSVRLDSNVVVSGQVRQGIEPQPLPQLNLDSIFGKLDAQVGKDLITTPTISGSDPMSWNSQRNGDLHVTGDLHLDNGILFVRGNLTVDGGITGEGAVFVDGETRIHRGANLNAIDQVAVVSRRKIVLEGQNKWSFFFKGLLYSEQEVVANNLTVLGAVIARGALELNEVNLLNAPVTISLIEGLELRNHSDDDTVQIIIRVTERDSETREPLSYKVQIRGYSDDAPTLLSAPREASGLRSYEDIKEFIRDNQGAVGAGWTKNSYRADWYWNASEEDHSATFTQDPLRLYLDILSGRKDDPQHRFTLDMNPNQLLGVLDRARVLLWQEI
jgi:cytoskeletal protein CcmA (bactofilin family)